MSALKKLDDNRIFYIELNTSLNQAIFTEACDSYYDCALDKAEMAELISELTNIYNMMPAKSDIEQDKERGK